jgi:hypothetical protein
MARKKKFLLSLFLVIFLFGFFISCPILKLNAAESTSQTEIDYPVVANQQPPTTLPEYIKYIFTFSLFVAGFLTILMLVFGGILLMTSTGNPLRLASAKKRLLNAVFGLILILFSISIISFINPDILNLNEFKIQEVKTKKSITQILSELKINKTVPSIGHSFTTYDVKKKVDCFDDALGEEDEDQKMLVLGGQPYDYCSKKDSSTIYCVTVIGSRDAEYTDEDWENENNSNCEETCKFGSDSCPKVEGNDSNCASIYSCEQLKDLKLKTDCNENYVYCSQLNESSSVNIPNNENPSSGNETITGGSNFPVEGYNKGIPPSCIPAGSDMPDFSICNGTSFGANRTNSGRYHAGIDLLSPQGTPVRAVADGTVIMIVPFCTYCSSINYLLMVNHENYVINYGEVIPEVSVGDKVNAGQRIATVSGVGMCHFELYKPGTTTNYRWYVGQPKPDQLLDPTEFLFNLVK